MSEINGINGIEGKNMYSATPAKKVDGNSSFSSYLGESKSMDQIFKQAADKYDVPVDLLKAIGKAESNFKANAVSRVGAQGVMQLMPATAKELGVTDPFDAEQNIMGGAKYISRMLKKYDGDARLALAAYNAGSGNVAKYNGIPPFKETQGYVKKVMGFYGGGNIEIAENINKATGSASQTSKLITPPTVNTAPIQRNLSFLFNNVSDSTTTGTDDLEVLFSYEDYLKFIEMFLDEEEKNTEEETNNSSKIMNYNAPIIDLIKNQNIF